MKTLSRVVVNGKAVSVVGYFGKKNLRSGKKSLDRGRILVIIGRFY